MVRVLRFIICATVSIFLVGCGGKQKKEEPVWEKIKVDDLAPFGGRQGQGQRLKTINFGVSVFEVPADRTGRLDELWQGLFVQPVRFKNYGAFRANSFEIGFGQMRDVAGVVNHLRSLGGKSVQVVNLLFEKGGSDELSVAVLPGEETLSYQSAEGSTKAVTVGPGRIVLRMKADKVLGMKGLCRLHSEAVAVPPVSGFSGFLNLSGPSDYVFDFSSFQLKMAPGDFVILGPGEKLDSRRSLSDHFFRRSRPSKLFLEPADERQRHRPYFGPVVRVYMIVCTGINV